MNIPDCSFCKDRGVLEVALGEMDFCPHCQCGEESARNYTYQILSCCREVYLFIRKKHMELHKISSMKTLYWGGTFQAMSRKNHLENVIVDFQELCGTCKNRFHRLGIGKCTWTIYEKEEINENMVSENGKLSDNCGSQDPAGS